MSTDRTPRWPVIAGTLVGLAFGVVGVRSLLDAAEDTRPAAAATWVIGLAVAHDLLLVPVILLAGVAVRRFSPAAARSWIGAGLVISGSVAVVAWPLVRGYGRSAGNPSILPRNYGAGLATTLILVWGAILALGLVARHRHKLEPNGAPE